MAIYGSEAENDSSPIDKDICARVAYEEDEDSVENDGENDAYRNDNDEEGSDDVELANVCDTKELNEEIEVQAICIDGQDEAAGDGKERSNRKKRKLGNFVECPNVVDANPCSLKRLAVIKAAEVSTNEANGIVSKEDFQCIKELKDEGYKAATFEIPSSEQLSAKRFNPVKLEAHLRSKLSKQEPPSSFMPQSSPYSENELGKKQTPLAQFLKFKKENHRPVRKQEHERSHGIKTYGSSKQDISDRDVTSVKAMLWGEIEQQESKKDAGGVDHRG
ncbi:hypothetical protein HPP92_006544 [Vanilla planifolia]|uniref:Uncharacterized protein n=1 Tax=Vanilla planifolia TaxID=51239 RepID=A0A835RJA5_VANPL|nr:hypothetical protein HPP92_006544 [Vanilla planifolia]